MLRVGDGTLTLRFNALITFEGRVGADGAVNVPNGKAALMGKFAGGRFTGGVSAGRCQYPLDLTK